MRAQSSSIFHSLVAFLGQQQSLLLLILLSMPLSSFSGLCLVPCLFWTLLLSCSLLCLRLFMTTRFCSAQQAAAMLAAHSCSR